MQKEIQVKINNSFQYHHSSGMQDAQFFLITCYSMKQMDKVMAIKEIVMAAMQKWQLSMPEEQSESIEEAKETVEIEKAAGVHVKKDIEEDKTGKGLLNIVYMNLRDGDGPKLFAYFKKLLTSGVVSIDGEVPFTGSHVDNVSPVDFENLMGEYLGNFILSSQED